jgi:hypothetical protein
LRQVDDDELENTATWVYSDKAGTMDYRIDMRSYIPFYDRQMFKGWNFLGITSEMSDVFVESGSCNIEKMVFWEDQEWDVITESVLAQIGMSYEKFGLVDDPQDLAHGVLIKVSNDCKLSSSIGEDISGPPGIPN